MTLTVRLDPATEAALDRYCADHGVTRSLVVQESLAVYLLASTQTHGGVTTARAGAAIEPVSPAYAAFAEAGLVGGVALGHGAGKPAVRERIAQRSAERKDRRGGA